jgi:hypothetical protein
MIASSASPGSAPSVRSRPCGGYTIGFDSVGSPHSSALVR